MIWFFIIVFVGALTAALYYFMEPELDQQGWMTPEQWARVERDQELRNTDAWFLSTFGRHPSTGELWELAPPLIKE